MKFTRNFSKSKCYYLSMLHNGFWSLLHYVDHINPFIFIMYKSRKFLILQNLNFKFRSPALNSMFLDLTSVGFPITSPSFLPRGPFFCRGASMSQELEATTLVSCFDLSRIFNGRERRRVVHVESGWSAGRERKWGKHITI